MLGSSGPNQYSQVRCSHSNMARGAPVTLAYILKLEAYFSLVIRVEYIKGYWHRIQQNDSYSANKL